MTLKLGELIYSKAGRDAGRRFIITKILNHEYVFISDGVLRKVEKPKKKKIKHIKTCGIVIESLKYKLENKERVVNAEIKKAISEWTKSMTNLKANEEG